MIRMNRLAQAAVLGLTLLAATGARAEDEQAIDQATADKITATLTAEGYEVRKLVMEDGMFEVYAVKDGAAWELYLDDALQIVKSCSDGACTDAEGNATESGESGEGN